MHRTGSIVRAVGRAIRGAFPAICVATLIPLAILYVGLALDSVVDAIIASVVYAYGVAAYQWRRNRRVSGMLLMTLLLVTIRALAAAATGSVFAYFVVPVVETAGFGLLFLASMFTSEPLIVRLARDFVPHLAEDLASRRSLIRWLSGVWTVTYLLSGATTLVLLLTQSIGVYAAAHELAGWAWVACGVGASIFLCRRKAQGLWHVALRRHMPMVGLAAAAPAAAA
ncbi:MAG TPA: VC0807 family protein [Acidimicrobiales bacterium]|nr:VC0807 family protein [Acidimicrobiales bacterium]